jgi:hypothetical protein
MTMPPFNMSFTVFVLDPRPFEQLRPALDEAFGGRFVEDLEYAANGMLRYTNQVFGLNVSCLREERWTEGVVYRLVGGNDAGTWVDTEAETDMAFHVLNLLGGAGLARRMTFDEFREESIRRKQPQQQAP